VLVLIERAGGGVVGNVNVGPAVVVEVGGEDTEAVGAVGAEDSSEFGNVGEGAVAVVAKENIFSADEAGRAASDHYAFIQAGAGLGDGCGGEIHVDVIGDEEIEFAVAIVVNEGATAVPAVAVCCDAGFFGDFGEGAVAVIVIETILAEVADEEIVEAVVVVIAEAAALSPARVGDAGSECDVSERAVAIIFEKARDGLLPLGKTFEARAVDEKDVEPAVVVVIVESDATTGGLEKIFVFVFAAVDGFCVEAGLFGDVEKCYAEGRRFSCRIGGSAFCVGRSGERKNVFKRENQSRAG